MKCPMLMGELKAEYLRGKEVFSFRYSKGWLESDYLQILDPELLLFSGSQYTGNDKPNFGLFLDSSPDRWGRLLMKRREAALADLEGRPQRTLRESDYLLGVYDEHRMGALRFKENPDGPFVNDNNTFATPPWTSIGELEHVSLMLENEESTDNPEYLHWLTLLVNPGSSLGGARPKASVVDQGRNLWIAKFPGSSDTKDIGGWEMVASELAILAGINAAKSMARKFSGRHHTFLSRRFDRTETGERIHYASAMTMLGYSDSNDYHGEASYLELVDFISKYGANVDEDLKELWTRIVFNIFISNTDDHLRNHGFLLTESGWILSPAFDMNPNEDGNALSLNVSLDSNQLSLDLAIGVAEYFRLNNDEADEIIERIRKSVSMWRKVAEKYKLPRSEQNLMTKVFERMK
jgi:serine/threonine-protein kinase HipA